jgi:hypothetical protein
VTTVTVALVNGRIRTNDVRRPVADAVAVAGELVALVGSSAEVRKLAGHTARVIDLRGATVYPEPVAAVLRRGAPANVVVRAAGSDGAELLRMNAGRIIGDTFG